MFLWIQLYQFWKKPRINNRRVEWKPLNSKQLLTPQQTKVNAILFIWQLFKPSGTSSYYFKRKCSWPLTIGIYNLKMKWSKSRNEGWWTRIKKTEMQASMACRVTKGASKKQSPATDRGIQKHLRNKKGSRRLKNSVRYVWTELNGRGREMLRQGCFCFECPQITLYSFYSYCSVDIPGC